VSIIPNFISLLNLAIASFCRETELTVSLHYLSPYTPKFGRYLWLRLLHCIGGLHISASISGYVWSWIYVSEQFIIPLSKRQSVDAVLSTCGILQVVLLTIVIVTAFPYFRRMAHDVFEFCHRYLRWIVFASFVVQVFYTQLAIQHTLLSPTPIIMFVLLILLVYPWTWVRRYKVAQAEVAANHLILTFRRRLPAHGFVRVSRDGNEWHSFAIAYVSRYNGTFDLLITRAGDWTGRLIDDFANNAPKHLYFRRRGIGFSYTLYCYDSVLFVCTGGGIAPGIMYALPRYPTTVHCLWISKDHRSIFGERYWNIVSNYGSRLHLWDTKKDGRPAIEMPVQLAKKLEVEAIFVVSNEDYTVKLMTAARKQNIPAYGATWDS